MMCLDLFEVTEYAEQFMDEVEVVQRPKLVFISKADTAEAVVNDLYTKSNTIYFNTHFFEQQSLDYILLIILHEIYHFAKQNISCKQEVTQLRDNRQWSFMQFCDVEADIHVASFLLKKNLISSFDDYLKILHQGSFVFRDSRIRMPKLERFVGSLSSIKNTIDTNHKIVWLPQISFPSVIVIGIDFFSGTIQHFSIPFGELDLENWMKVYQDAPLIPLSDYTHLIKNLTKDFINILKMEGGHAA